MLIPHLHVQHETDVPTCISSENSSVVKNQKNREYGESHRFLIQERIHNRVRTVVTRSPLYKIVIVFSPGEQL